MVRENGVIWLNVDEFTQNTGKSNSLAFSMRSHEKGLSPEKQRTRKINGKLHIREDYLDINRQKIDEVYEMFFEIKRDFKSELKMAEYFAKKYNANKMGVYRAFNDFCFKRTFKKYHLWFSKYLEQKKQNLA